MKSRKPYKHTPNEQNILRSIARMPGGAHLAHHIGFSDKYRPRPIALSEIAWYLGKIVVILRKRSEAAGNLEQHLLILQDQHRAIGEFLWNALESTGNPHAVEHKKGRRQ